MRSVLVVDDSAVVRQAACAMLEKLGFSASGAETGLAALARFRAAPPSAVLLEWDMPAMDGLTLLKHLRAEPGGRGAKVVFCTGRNDLPHITAALAAGADEYLMKPFDENILRSKLNAVGLL